MKNNAETFKILSVFVASAVIGFLLYNLLMITVVDDFIYKGEYDRGSAVFEFCKSYIPSEKPIALIMGSSIAIMSFNSEKIQIKDYEVYNIGLGDAGPVALSLYTECINSMKPEVVIYPVSIIQFGGDMSFDKYVLILDDIEIDSADVRYAWQPPEVQDALDWNVWEINLYKRKYLIQMFFNVVKGMAGRYSPFRYITKQNMTFYDMKNPYIVAFQDWTPQVIKDKIIVTKMDESLKRANSFNSSENFQKSAFKFVVGSFEDSEVVIVNVPINPLVLNNVKEKSIDDFDNFLVDACKNPNCHVVDMTFVYGSENDSIAYYDHAHFKGWAKDEFSEVFSEQLNVKGIDECLQCKILHYMMDNKQTEK